MYCLLSAASTDRGMLYLPSVDLDCKGILRNMIIEDCLWTLQVQPVCDGRLTAPTNIQLILIHI